MSSKKTVLGIICFVAFISLGLPDGLLGVAWPYMQVDYDVPLESLGMVLICFTAGYLASSFNSGRIIEYLSIGVLLVVSCALTGLSLLGFAFGSYWEILLVAAFLLGVGGGAIDASINTFAAQNFSTSTVNWLHAFYGIGATLGPLIMTGYLVSAVPWFSGYVTVSAVQITLAFIFILTLGLWKSQTESQEPVVSAKTSETLRLPVVWLSLIVFFLYTGIEVSIGQWLFTVLTKSRNIGEVTAGFWTSVYWGSLTVGRIVFGIVLTRVPVNKVLLGSFLAVVIAAVLILLDISNIVTLLGIFIAGFALAPVFPSLISLTPKRVGSGNAANAVGFQISAAMTGGALLPAFAGLTIDRFGLEMIPVIHLIESGLLLLFYVWLAKKYKVED